MPARFVTLDGNEAAARIAYLLSEVIAIYPITPASAMGESADEWASKGHSNIWGVVPDVIEMQSEAGAAAVLHGAIQGGALGTTFTASQGLLLMIPEMYKIAGELTPTVIHVAARSLATQALSIFGDHSDVMATRSTGFAMLASGSVQEAMDLALLAHAVALESLVPFLHFFDGFRTSHEVSKIEELSEADVRLFIEDDTLRTQRLRGMSPERPSVRGTAQNPDVYFQAREAANPFYRACPAIVEQAMHRFERLFHRRYRLFDYYGAPDATTVIVSMGSGAETVQQTAEALTARGEKVGALTVRLYRPFSVAHFLAVLPPTVRTLVALDRTKEPGSIGEPLYLDLAAALDLRADLLASDGRSEEKPHPRPRLLGGRYGLSSKDFTPAMAKAIFDHADTLAPGHHFTIGIVDDVTHTSIPWDPSFSLENPRSVRALFFGLGSDGTVSANKNSIKIIGEETDNFAQGYFVYDSKKAGSRTISHLRFGPSPIAAPYLIERANFIACHHFSLLDRMDVLKAAEEGAVFLLNSSYGPGDIWNRLPAAVRRNIVEKKLRFFAIDASGVAREAALGNRINTVLQTAFFAISGVLPRDEAVAAVKHSIDKTYRKKGDAVVQKNFAAVDRALDHLYQIAVPSDPEIAAGTGPETSHIPSASGKDSGSGGLGSARLLRLERGAATASPNGDTPAFAERVLKRIIAGDGELLPVSAMPPDGVFPSGTARYEKRNLAEAIPVWDTELCIQCGKCVLVCPHAAIRAKVVHPDLLAGAPPTFKSAPARWRQFEEERYVLQIAPEDCTGCTLCREICPAKSKSDPEYRALNMAPQLALRDPERANWNFFLRLPQTARGDLSVGQVKDAQLLEPLFEFSGACSGCGETPYIRLLTQLFGDRLVVANATGCSSIYGANLPTTPWAMNEEGRGPAWANSLFEDNAEFGLGLRLALDRQQQYARDLLHHLTPLVGEELTTALLMADQSSDAGIEAQRSRIAELKLRLEAVETGDAEMRFEGLLDESSARSQELLTIADSLVRRSVWIIGGDGWAYDIGFGGLDHVLASGHNVKVLVLDTEVYSNTGGQASKSTPRAAVARFATSGKRAAKKNLAAIAMTYGNTYVAQIAMGGGDTQTVKALLEAEAYPGPALVISYGHCIAHGYDMASGLEQQKAAVLSGYWPLFRYNPLRRAEGKNPLQLDSRAPTIPLEEFLYREQRFAALRDSDPEAARTLLEHAKTDVLERWRMYEYMAAMPAAEQPAAVGRV
jgi:pyruvate-ferredoxin/flavodoxin oxidoreductase